MNDLESLCVWYITNKENQEGKGTTFVGRTPEDLECFGCDGHKYYQGQERACYMPANETDIDMLEDFYDE